MSATRGTPVSSDTVATGETLRRQTRCKSCRAPVFYAQTVNGKAQIFDFDPDPEGLWEMENRGCRDRFDNPTFTAVYHAGQQSMFGTGTRFTDHHATCPHARQWSERAARHRDERMPS